MGTILVQSGALHGSEVHLITSVGATENDDGYSRRGGRYCDP